MSISQSLLTEILRKYLCADEEFWDAYNKMHQLFSDSYIQCFNLDFVCEVGSGALTDESKENIQQTLYCGQFGLVESAFQSLKFLYSYKNSYKEDMAWTEKTIGDLFICSLFVESKHLSKILGLLSASYSLIIDRFHKPTIDFIGACIQVIKKRFAQKEYDEYLLDAILNLSTLTKRIHDEILKDSELVPAQITNAKDYFMASDLPEVRNIWGN